MLRQTCYNLARLRSSVRPFRLHFFPRLRSTNDHAAVLRKRGELFAPAIVLTSRQTAGRGRGNNSWWSAGGCITVTFALPIDEHLSPTQVPLAAGLAVRNAAAEIAERPDIRLKWPNDIVFDGRKLAGLLCERIHRVDLIGVGLNLNVDLRDAPKSLRPRITSLSEIAGQRFDATGALAALARHLLLIFSRRRGQPFPGLLREYDRHHDLAGRRIMVHAVPISRDVPLNKGDIPAFLQGRCEGLDDIGRLLLRCGRRLHRLVSGHVEVCDNAYDPGDTL